MHKAGRYGTCLIDAGKPDCYAFLFGISSFVADIEILALYCTFKQPEAGASSHNPHHLGRTVDSENNITQMLQAAAAGDSGASDELFTTVYQELRLIARAHRQRWRGNDTLNTTALINEAYLKLTKNELASFENRTHFYATASKAMRHILISYAERAATAKRGGDAIQVTLSGLRIDSDNTLDDLLVINAMLEKLEQENSRHCQLFDCRVFGGMTIKETATAIGVSPATVKRDWTLLSAWVYREVVKERIN